MSVKPLAFSVVMDFKEIERKVREKVIDKLDHSYLNETVEVSTCENLAVWIWQNLEGLDLHHIKLYETEDSWVTYMGEPLVPPQK
jgi:6-pyruvoyltetrahydropterin/6-carboxytetrahydropterin synthase